MSESATTPSWWPTVVTWLLVILGWFAVHLATLKRERRKERREVAQNAIDELREVGMKALTFHTAAAFDGVVADELIYQTNRVIRFLQRSPLSALDLPLGRMVRLRKAITLTNADKSSFRTQAPGSQVLLDIRAAVDDMVEVIEAVRDKRWK